MKRRKVKSKRTMINKKRKGMIFNRKVSIKTQNSQEEINKKHKETIKIHDKMNKTSSFTWDK